MKPQSNVSLWSVAMFTTKTILGLIGLAAVIAFACTLKPLFLTLFVLAAVCGWAVLFKFFLEMARRGARAEREENSAEIRSRKLSPRISTDARRRQMVRRLAEDFEREFAA